MSRLRRWFLTGFFVTVPLVVSVTAIVWMFRVVDGLTQGLYERWLGTPVPGLGLATTLLIVLCIGIVATNVIGRRILGRGEQLLMHVPVFRTVYAPVKQLILAFSPDNEFGFKRVVMVEDAARGYLLGFLTREFTLTEGGEAKPFVAVYVPTNHLYLGDVIVCPVDRVTYPDLTVEQGIRVFLTGGMGLPGGVKSQRNISGHFSEPGV
ncbi:MAG: DUF502 domain-containing protein [Vicinamibacterales bacterium]|jgi:uncharacterized membrane protein